VDGTSPTANHWANAKTTLDYMHIPYIDRRRHELHLSNNFPTLVIYNKFKAQCTDAAIRENNIHILMVPACCRQATTS